MPPAQFRNYEYDLVVEAHEEVKDEAITDAEIDYDEDKKKLRDQQY